MKKMIFIVLLLLISFVNTSNAQYSYGNNLYAKPTRVKGYTKKNGTYVAPHYRTQSNKYTYDNYSTRGNTNPYTGKRGSRPSYNNSLNKRSSSSFRY